jgi:hypothetical protein
MEKTNRRKKPLMARVFMRLLAFSAQISQHKHLHGLAYPLMRFFAWYTLKSKKAQLKNTAEAVALEWQRMFPAPPTILEVDEDGRKVIAQINTHCPLRDTGDWAACHRLMEYDRTMVRKMGGKFTVLTSQSTSGEPFCRVSIELAEKIERLGTQ